MNMQMKYEDWQKKYEDVLEDYKKNKAETSEYKSNL